jgi:hypothetical protein
VAAAHDHLFLADDDLDFAVLASLPAHASTSSPLPGQIDRSYLIPG